MKISNTTTVAPNVIESLMGKYNVPDWLVFVIGTIVVLVFAYALICQKFSQGSKVCYSGCSIFCSACTGCLLASSENCTHCTEGYKNFIVRCYDCLTFAPRYIRAQRALDSRMEQVIRSPPKRQLPLLKIGPNPLDV